MTSNSINPHEYDAVLGDNSPILVDAVVLGGIEGLQQRLETGNTQQKIDSLADTLKYGEAGIDLLIEALNDGEIKVRAKAFKILKTFDSTKVKQIVDKGIPLNKGDEIYSVCESILEYNDDFYRLIDNLDSKNLDYFKPSICSKYLFREKAEKAALIHHQWRALKEDIYLIYSLQKDNDNTQFNIINWCKYHNLIIHLPDESIYQFEQRLIATLHGKSTLEIYKDNIYQSPGAINKYKRYGLHKLELKVISYLKENHQYELLGQLWFEKVGKLAFVHEDTVETETYFKENKIVDFFD